MEEEKEEEKEEEEEEEEEVEQYTEAEKIVIRRFLVPLLLLKSKMGLIIADFGEKREEGIWSLHPSG